MAVNASLDKVSVNVLLNNGQTATGNVSTLSVNLGTLSTTGYDDQKAMNIVSMLGDCLSKPVYTTKRVNVYTLVEE
mgnify:CR=1 FL=1